MTTYRTVLRGWAGVFAAVGLSFWAAPAAIGELLTALAALLGLKGTIAAPASNLWWVLALSLMATITVLAEASARRPRETAPYAALLTAKLVSTMGFLGLAAAHGSAWAICAVGDGFVALTLWLARRAIPAEDGARQSQGTPADSDGFSRSRPP